MNTFNLTLDLNKSRASSPVRLRQGDAQGTTITALVLDHGATADLTGYTAQFVMDLPDGTHYYRKAASIDGNSVSVMADEAQAASVPGRAANAYFQMLQGTMVKASTGSFTVEILPDALADATVPESYDSAIQDAIDALDAAVEQIPDMVEDVLEAHPEWTTTVQDGSITKDKLATDLARDRERLLYRLDNLLTNALPEGETATASDAAKTPVAGLALYGRSTQDGTPTPSAPVAIQSVTPNLYQQTRQVVGTTYTVSGLTFTYDSTNSATVSGTSTANAVAAWPDNVADDTLFVHVHAGTYTATSSHNVEVKKRVGTTLTTLVTYGTQRLATFTLAEDTDILVVPVLIGNGVDFTGTRVWACLFAGSAPSVGVSYGHVGLWARGRNLFVGISASDSRNGLDKAYDSSTNTLTISGTSTASNNDLPVVLTYPIQVPEGARLILSLSGTVSAGDKSRFIVFVRNQNGYGEYHGMDSNNTITFTEQGGKVVKEIMFRSNTYTGAININAHVQLEFGTTATAYHPYTATVMPIPLDGHELRSLPDGTRDELTVDERGHVVLTQRVGHVVLDGSSVAATERRVPTSPATATRMIVPLPSDAAAITAALRSQFRSDAFTYSADAYGTANKQVAGIAALYQYSSVPSLLACIEGTLTVAQVNEWLAANEPTLLYPLATPVTIDLGYVAAVPLCGPDLTAQAIPTAPFALTYERDLNTTLARLESAIAELATN